jgi:hypothetical protein
MDIAKSDHWAVGRRRLHKDGLNGGSDTKGRKVFSCQEVLPRKIAELKYKEREKLDWKRIISNFNSTASKDYHTCTINF